MNRNRNMRFPQKKKNAGWTLVEIVIAIVIAGILAAGGYNVYSNWQQNQKSESMLSILNKSFDTLPKMKTTYGSYDGLNNAYAYTSKRIVLDTTKSPTANKFVTPFSTDGLTYDSVDSATLKSGRVLSGTDQFISIIANDVEGDLCQDIVEGMFARIDEIRVGSTRVATAPAITTACAAAGTSINITFINN
ncbi:prepilin-type N-terminal cleavage/methylation domain-containing protein [Aliivibrio sp. S3MY1]|uniref:prepilin-type N-terminal cleavage/methylation domain-containing protein n=1 Tax=unclassified Aliivibrio TaxID=2645654 RepID=UPI0023794122|nr:MULTISPECIES: prepilin-type N-terminal cleavage/methylation domain-containing protein [unclassified Aliivibrio]MDD9175991.1 prepilin-type N-terminal cleavage/methylation domain-containing protein [Aliivibrio sp. S3TY1]MDD9193094.1 prepilin-type N-terminal cleavage/methylation domain-containing protein [Aliivibrio sp. S2TY2]MDD9195798.1 prepilin-type N-terminal cleavage/methylation domain-containing protein [Aliivibrio sp. S3MY1]